MVYIYLQWLQFHLHFYRKYCLVLNIKKFVNQLLFVKKCKSFTEFYLKSNLKYSILIYQFRDLKMSEKVTIKLLKIYLLTPNFLKY